MDEKYFEKLLEDARAECKKYELPQKDVIIDCLSKYPVVQSTLKQNRKLLGRLEKQHKPQEEKDAAKEAIEKWEQEQEKVFEEVLNLLPPILNEEITLNESDELEVNLMKCAILNQAGPKELARFCEEEDPSLITELLDSVPIMKEMLIAGGAKKGKWGRAYQLYKQLNDMVDNDDKHADIHKRLALAVALEHADPIPVYGYVNIEEKPNVDPIERWKHYVQALKRGELDPAFPYFDAWEYRLVVNSDASDDQLQWGRDHLKRYRPDQVAMGDMKWRYAISVKSDVGYRQPNWTADPRTYQQMASGGGKCGPRAWYGRYICKAHGIPTWGVKQPGHAAASRWTPNEEGWVTLLGAGWPQSNWDSRPGHIFRAEAHARAYQHKNEGAYYCKVVLLECMAEAYNEHQLHGEKKRYSDKFLWRSLVNVQRTIWCDSATEEHFKRGPGEDENGDSCPCSIEEYLAREDNPKQDNIVEALEDGTIRIPACASNKQKQVDVYKCFEGGGQIHLQAKTSEMEYAIPDTVPDQDYELTCKICNVHLGHEKDQLCVQVNKENAQEASIPYTVGEWGYTSPVQVHLKKGDVLKFTRKCQDGFGLTMREILLKPC